MYLKKIKNITIQLFIIIFLSIPISNIELLMNKIRYSEGGIVIIYLILFFLIFALLITVLSFFILNFINLANVSFRSKKRWKKIIYHLLFSAISVFMIVRIDLIVDIVNNYMIHSFFRFFSLGFMILILFFFTSMMLQYSFLLMEVLISLGKRERIDHILEIIESKYFKYKKRIYNKYNLHDVYNLRLYIVYGFEFFIFIILLFITHYYFDESNILVISAFGAGFLLFLGAVVVPLLLAKILDFFIKPKKNNLK